MLWDSSMMGSQTYQVGMDHHPLRNLQMGDALTLSLAQKHRHADSYSHVRLQISKCNHASAKRKRKNLEMTKFRLPRHLLCIRCSYSK